MSTGAAAMYWTRKAPDKPGWWWRKASDFGVRAVRIAEISGQLFLVGHKDGPDPLDSYAEGWWSDRPIPEPLPPEGEAELPVAQTLSSEQLNAEMRAWDAASDEAWESTRQRLDRLAKASERPWRSEPPDVPGKWEYREPAVARCVTYTAASLDRKIDWTEGLEWRLVEALPEPKEHELVKRLKTFAHALSGTSFDETVSEVAALLAKRSEP